MLKIRELEALKKAITDEYSEATFVAKAQVQTITNDRVTIVKA